MPPSAAHGEPIMRRLTTAWTMSGVILYLLAPRIAPGVLVLCAVAPTLWYRAAGGKLAWHRPSRVFVLLAAAGLYMLINGTWSLDPTSAYSEIAWYLVSIAALYVTLSALRAIPAEVLRAMAVGFIAGMILGGAFLCFEAFSEQLVHRTLLSYVPAWAPNPRDMRMEAGSVSYLAPYLLNRSTTALAVLLWPAALTLNSLNVSSRKQAMLRLGLGLAVAAIFRSTHATAKIALIGSAASFAVFWISPKLARRLTITGWIAATLLVIPTAMLAYANQLYLANWLDNSARHRIVIWGYTSEQITKAPVLGAGISTARALNNSGDLNTPRAPGTNYPLSTGWHSHNGYLQAWYETGAVGALLLLWFGVAVLRSMASAPAEAEPYLLAAFVSCALVAGSSFSLWAPWFMASFGICAVFAVLGAELVGRRSAPKSGMGPKLIRE